MMAAAKAHFGCGRKVHMSAIGKAALFLAATSSVLAAAQTQTSPAQKPSPAVAASPAPTGQQRVPVSPYGHRAVPAQGQFHPYQPGTPVQPAVRPPAIPQAVATPAVQPPPVLPKPVQAPVPAPVIAQPPVQQPAMQPVIDTAAASGAAAVDYSHGQLTVVSEKATLGQVLKLVAAKTGGVVDVAPELQGEPVIARLGPGPVREVLTDLLDSPKIDYIVMGAGDGRSGLQRIVVRTRQSFGRMAMAALPAAQPQQQLPQEAKSTGQPANGPTPAEAKLTQEQLMENWKKSREQMRLAEIHQQARERETEQNNTGAEPQTEPQAEEPNGPPPPPDNPPQQ